MQGVSCAYRIPVREASPAVLPTFQIEPDLSSSETGQSSLRGFEPELSNHWEEEKRKSKTKGRKPVIRKLMDADKFMERFSDESQIGRSLGSIRSSRDRNGGFNMINELRPPNEYKSDQKNFSQNVNFYESVHLSLAHAGWRSAR